MKQKINMCSGNSTSLKAVWEAFIVSQTARGISDATIANYHNHLRGIGKHLDIDMPFDKLTKRDLEAMVVSMREAELAHNTVATYLRVMNTFLRWCQREGLSNVSIPNLKEKDTVKETYHGYRTFYFAGKTSEGLRFLRIPKLGDYKLLA